MCSDQVKKKVGIKFPTKQVVDVARMWFDASWLFSPEFWSRFERWFPRGLSPLVDLSRWLLWNTHSCPLGHELHFAFCDALNANVAVPVKWRHAWA